MRTGLLADKVPAFAEAVRARLRDWEVKMYSENRKLFKIPTERRDEKQHEIVQQLEVEWTRARRPFTTSTQPHEWKGAGRTLADAGTAHAQGGRKRKAAAL